MRRLGLVALFVTLVAVVVAPDARAAVPVVVVDGRGWGHGVGMAQDGAFWMGTDGASRDAILDHFYPGTGRGSNTGTVRVVVLVAADGRATLTFPQGGEVRSPRTGPQRAGFPVRVDPGGSVTVVHDGGYRVEPSFSAAQVGSAQPVQLPTTSSTSSTSSSTTTTTRLLPSVTQPPSSTTTTAAPGATTTTTAPGQPPGTAPPGGAPVSSPDPVWAGPVSGGSTVGLPARGLSYRGELEVSAAGGPLRVINELDVEQYLWGLGEVGASFPPAAIEAQMVAARTYALRAMAANGEICDTQRCQVYKGANGEFRGQLDAVSRTLGVTLGYGGRFASAVYSANAGGFSATPEEGFGTPNATHPYLVAARYVTHTDDVWQVRIALADLASRLHYPGTATAIKVVKTGPSGRAIEVELDGDTGPFRANALDVDAAMGLRSTFWSMRLLMEETAPEAPDAAALIQAQPEAVGAVIAEDTRAAIRRDRRARSTSTIELAAGSSTDDDDGVAVLPALLVLVVLAAGGVGVVTLRRAGDPPR